MECLVAQMHFVFTWEVSVEYVKAYTQRHTQTQKAHLYVKYTFIVHIHRYM